MLDKHKLRECSEAIKEIRKELGWRSLGVGDGSTFIPVSIQLDAHWFVTSSNCLVISDDEFEFDRLEEGQFFEWEIRPDGVRRREGFTIVWIDPTNKPERTCMFVLDNDKECRDAIKTRLHAAEWQR